jgi:hypothetical protein
MQSQAFKILLDEIRKVGKDLKGAESRIHYRIDRHVDKLGKRVDEAEAKTEAVNEKLVETRVDVGKLKVRVGVFSGLAAIVGGAMAWIKAML